MRKLPATSLNLVSVVVILSATVVFLILPRTATNIVDAYDRESGWVELISALFYLAGCVICVYRLVTKTPYNRPYLYLWAGLCFVFFGEETSWLQHIIGYGTPEAIGEINVQNEFNLHNLLEAGSWHDMWTRGKLDYTVFLNTTTLFRVGFFSYFLLVPVLMHAGFFGKARRKLKFPLPTIGFIVSLSVTMAMSALGYYFNIGLRMDITEARELYYALYVMLYVYFALGNDSAGA